jgi:hypothetical protein
MARYALINGSTVVTVVEMSAEQATAALTSFEIVHLLPDTSRCAGGWSYAGGDVVEPTVDLGALAAEQWEAIKAERDRRSQHGGYPVTIGGVRKWFHSDLFSRSQQIGLVILGAGVPGGLQWKTMDGTFVTMTQAVASAVFASAAAQDQATFAAAELGRQSLNADPAVFSLDSIQWPAIYEG